jgi:hypothetical protein
MPLTLELPPPINEELTQDSQREGISEKEHAALLVCLASAFKQEEPHTPFQKAVRVFLSHHSLDADQVVSVFEGLVQACLESNDAWKLKAPTGEGKTLAAFQFLRQWRNSLVHQPVDESHDFVFSDAPPIETISQAQGRIARQANIEKKESDPRDRVHELLVQWQTEDRTPLRSPMPARPGETPTQALFRKWAEEDARMSDEEKDAEDRLWAEIEKGIQENRLALGTRSSEP